MFSLRWKILEGTVEPSFFAWRNPMNEGAWKTQISELQWCERDWWCDLACTNTSDINTFSCRTEEGLKDYIIFTTFTSRSKFVDQHSEHLSCMWFTVIKETLYKCPRLSVRQISQSTFKHYKLWTWPECFYLYY